MKKNWQYLINQFENSTRDSYKKAVNQSPSETTQYEVEVL